MDASDAIRRLAQLAVGFGANVQPGQIVNVSAEVGHEELVRAVAEESYRRGAKFVDVWYWDPHVKRARIAYAPHETLEYVPPWYGERVLALGEHRCAKVAIAGATGQGLLDDLDPARAGRDQLPRVRESGQVVGERTTNWTIVPFPTAGWARRVHPDLPDEEALAHLWKQIVHVCRLDEPDAVAAWEQRMDITGAAAEKLNEARFDALHFEGPGTDLTLGLLPTSLWRNARFSTVDGIPHIPNVPSEEVFTSPDPERTEGRVRSTKPLVLEDGTVVRGLEIRFEGGRGVEIRAESGAATMEMRCALDEGAARLGEVALVDREGRIGRLETIFYDTLLDENAASHLALGNGFPFSVGEEDVPRVNESGTHIDFMVGGDDVSVTGVTCEGERVPVLVGGAWRL